MTARYAAPAKLNLNLLITGRRGDGLHELESLVQTVGHCDLLEAMDGDTEDELEVAGPAIEGENLVLSALAALRRGVAVPPMRFRLTKRIPAGAGLGGGSSDAAAALIAAAEAHQVGMERVEEAAAEVGSDVPLFLRGGTQLMSGTGERLARRPPLRGVAFAVAVPPERLVTGDVYRRWDEMGGPEGEALRPGDLPPRLRDGPPIRNDLLPAALDLLPELGDVLAELRSLWGRSVAMTGSGSGCFAYFPGLDEARDAAESTSRPPLLQTFAAGPRDEGVALEGG